MDIFRNNPNRAAVVNGLAIAGFIALVGAGVWLAVYSTRFVPTVAGRIGSAAVYLSTVFEKPSLSVVSDASTTIPFGEASSTPVATSTAVATTPKQPSWTPGTPVAVAGTDTSTPAPVVNYYGLPDLAVAIETVGYTAPSSGSTTPDGIVSATTIPAGAEIAVKFRVTNIGTNVSGPWTMNISIPAGGTQASQTFSQNPLAPSQPSEYIARFDHIPGGAGRTIVITIDPSHQLAESSTANNIASSTVTVLGS